MPIEQQHLDQIEPSVALPNPATHPAGTAPFEALELYAQGRDALLSNRKQAAVEKFTAAIELDPSSSVAFRDLGYAWLGTDNDRALSAYRSAVELNPADADSRMQLARLLINKNDHTAAVEQLRLARLTDDYAEHDVDAAAIDLLLGKLLTDRGYKRAAVECLLNVLPVVENPPFELRTRPELIELAGRPVKLKVWIADLSSQIGEYDQALAYYEQIRAEEPATAAGIELRVIQTLARKGDIELAARQMLDLVDRYQASRASMQPYIDLFAERGGDAAAKAMLEKLRSNDAATNASRVLQARLLRRLGNPSVAAELLKDPKIQPSVAAVRETMIAFRASGQSTEAPLWLLQQMVASPGAMPAISRGWSILSNGSQPSPLTVRDLSAMKVPDNLEAARQFALARLASNHGQPVTAKKAIGRASELDASRLRQWVTARDFDGPPDVEYSASRDLELYIEEYSNEPDYLTASVAFLVKNNQGSQLLPALQAVVEHSPDNLAATGALVVLLQASDRTAEAIQLLERAATKVQSAAELYQVSAMLTQLNQQATAEKVLRQSHNADPMFAATCNDLGYLLADSGRELDFAEELLYRAVGMEPENAAYIDSLGWLLYKRSKFDEAKKYLEQALSASDPADPVVLDHAADAAYRTGDTNAAKRYWDLAIDQIKKQGTSEPQLRLKIEQKLKQLSQSQPVDVASAP